MAHIHGVFDSDTHFVIDPITRQLKNETSKKASVVQFDHDSERFTFELPRIIEGHDMTTCNVVQVHYLNIEAKTKIENKGLYEVDDLQISPEDGNTVICSWLISQNATQLDGSISFLVRFSCVTEGEPNYIWQTAPYTAITVTTGINNAEHIAEKYSDIIEQWRNQLENIYEGKQGEKGEKGEPGESVYEIAVKNGFEGSEAEWLESLHKVTDGSITPEKLDREYVTKEDFLEEQSIWETDFSAVNSRVDLFGAIALTSSEKIEKVAGDEELDIPPDYMKRVPVTEADEGKFLRVNDKGEWVAEELPTWEGGNY